MSRLSLCAAMMAALVFSAAAAAQQDTTRGVRIGLTYQPGTKPGVVVLPVSGPWGDTVQVMLQRDFDAGDRIEVISGDAVNQAASAPGAATNFNLWKSLGAAAVVQVALVPTGAHVILYDIGQRRVAQISDVPLQGTWGGADWRMAVHALSDEVERWITGVRGIAATRILYVSGGRIYMTDSDGWGMHAVTDQGTVLGPTWSPDGRTFAYVQLVRTGWNVIVRDLHSGVQHTIAATPGGLNMSPTFSPDGSSICYAHGDEDGTDLYIVSAAGAGPARRVTVGRGTDNVSPTYSPDGSRIAFTSGRAGHPEVYTADADGSNVDLLTPFNFGDQNYRSNPDWSPDGRQIAFQSQIDGRFQIMTISLRDRSVKQLTSEGTNTDPSWAPDGRHLVFTSTRTGVQELFVLDTESGRTRQLTHSPSARLAAWSHYLGQVH